MKLQMKIDGAELEVELYPNQMSRDLVLFLPLQTKAYNIFSQELVGYLPRPLIVSGQQVKEFQAGDFIYSPAGREVSVIYGSFSQRRSVSEAYLLGKVTGNLAVAEISDVADLSIDVVRKSSSPLISSSSLAT